MAGKYEFDAAAALEASVIESFVAAATSFCLKGRRPQTSLKSVFALFLQPHAVPFVPWKSIETALDWGTAGIATRRSTLADKLRDVAFEMACTWDSQQCRAINPSFISVVTVRGRGLALRRLTHRDGEPIAVAVRRRLRGRMAMLQEAEPLHRLTESEARELRSLRIQLDDEQDLRERVVGAYKIVDELGRGGTAVVYRAVHQFTNAEFALKLLHSTTSGDHEFCQRFFRGAQAMMRLVHPNIVRIADVGGIHDGRPYYVAELISGGTLSDVIDARQRKTAHAKLTIVTGMIAGLAEAHRRGICHRDFSPENVLLDATGIPKITDFDCAYVPLTTTLTTRAVPGTLRYMSPERMLNPNARDFDDDVFALGVVALELLIEKRDVAPDKLLQEMDKVPTLRPLHRVLLRCIAPRDRGRYRDAMTLEAEWRRTLDRPGNRSWWAPVWSPHGMPTQYAGASMKGRRFDRMLLSRANFEGATLTDCSFRDCALGNATFIRARLTRCTFDGAFMLGVRFRGCHLQSCTFRMANLERTVWDDVDLAGTDLSGANLWGAFMEQSRGLVMANLEATNFARNSLSPEQERLLAERKEICRATDYGAMIDEAAARHGGQLPQHYWWLALFRDDPELALLYY